MGLQDHTENAVNRSNGSYDWGCIRFLYVVIALRDPLKTCVFLVLVTDRISELLLSMAAARVWQILALFTGKGGHSPASRQDECMCMTVPLTVAEKRQRPPHRGLV